MYIEIPINFPIVQKVLFIQIDYQVHVNELAIEMGNVLRTSFYIPIVINFFFLHIYLEILKKMHTIEYASYCTSLLS